MGSKPVPTRLKREPLYEAVWELRFHSKQPVFELLTGTIFSESNRRNWGLRKISHLPASNVPPTLRRSDGNLRYLPVIRLDGSPISISIGEHVIAMSCVRPYIGWRMFGTRILELASVVRETGLVDRPERFSLKYLDIIEGAADLGMLSVAVSIAGRQLRSEPLQVRTELRVQDLLHIVEIAVPAHVVLQSGEQLQGTAVSTDTICLASEGAQDFWETFEARLGQIHASNKELFFQLLSEQTLQYLEPEFG